MTDHRPYLASSYQTLYALVFGCSIPVVEAHSASLGVLPNYRQHIETILAMAGVDLEALESIDTGDAVWFRLQGVNLFALRPRKENPGDVVAPYIPGQALPRHQTIYAGEPVSKRCHYCQRRHGATVDHIVPRCVGGLNLTWNIVLACSGCNGAKGNKPPECECGVCTRAVSLYLAGFRKA